MSEKKQKQASTFLGTGLTATISITLVLFLLGVTIFITFMGREVATFIKENLSVTIEIEDETNQKLISDLEKQLSEAPYVKTYHFIGKEDIKKDLIEELGSDPEEILGYIPGNSFFEIFLKSEYANSDSITNIKESLEKHSVINSFIYSEDTLNVINSNLKKIAISTLILSAILMFISFTLIRNTIRLSIYAKRFLINTMQLVGATNGFIRRPFIMQSILFGILASIFANIGVTGLIYILSTEFPEILSMIDIQNLLVLYVTITLVGITITVLATVSAVNKYLKTHINKLYYI